MTSPHCDWCGRAIVKRGSRWHAVKGAERGYDALACDANANDEDQRHEPAVPATVTPIRAAGSTVQNVPRRDLEPHVTRIVAAMDGMIAAKVERDQAVADALKADMSIREAAAVSGMSPTTVQKIGRDNGWPTAKQRREWDTAKAESEAFKDRYTPGWRDQP